MAEGEVMQEVLAGLQNAGIIAILRGVRPELMVERAKELVSMGARALEITLDSRDALQILAQLHELMGDSILLGVGTVMDAAQIDAAAEAGARFALSPVQPHGMIPRCHSAGILAVPGVSTPDEMWRAHTAGAEAIKLYPASSWSLQLLGSLPSPFHTLRLIPTGGIGRKRAWEWLDGGAWGVGMSSQLVGRDITIDPTVYPGEAEEAENEWRRIDGPRTRGILMELQRRLMH